MEALYSSGLVYVDDAVVFHRLHGGNQSNARVGEPRIRKRLSRARLRLSTSFVPSDRILLYQTLDYLGRSVMIDRAARQALAQAAELCFYAWYQHIDYRRDRGRDTERQLHRLLDRFASSPADLALFDRRVRSITRPQYGLVNLGEAYLRYVD